MDQAFPPRISWARARDALRTMFSAEGLESIQVEIFDRKRAFMPWVLPLRPDDMAVRTYEAKREYLLPIVKESLKKNWIAMSLFGLGSRSGSVKSALVVFVQPGTFQNWTDISSSLRKIWSDPTISIEFLPGKVPQSIAVPGIALEYRHTRHPQMGSSIVEHNQVGAGTLGGHVILERNGIKHYGVLTNHHVVRPLSAPTDTTDKLDQYGYGSTHPQFTTLVQFPALDDLKVSKEKVEADIIRSDAETKEIEAKLQRFEYKEQEPPKLLLYMLSRQGDSLAKLNERKDCLNQLPIILGKVLYSSGEAISSKNSIVDWAFVELDDAKTFPEHPNKLPNADVSGLAGKLADYFDLPGRLYDVADDKPEYARYFARIEKGKWYFKIGRTSGITAGMCHGTEMEVSRVGQIRWNERGEKVTLGTNSTREVVIIGKEGPRYSTDGDRDAPDTFSVDGDPGSFVIDSYGHVAGLLYGSFCFAGADGWFQAYAGLVTSMDEVLDSIKAKTGGELSLP